MKQETETDKAFVFCYDARNTPITVQNDIAYWLQNTEGTAINIYHKTNTPYTVRVYIDDPANATMFKFKYLEYINLQYKVDIEHVNTVLEFTRRM